MLGMKVQKLLRSLEGSGNFENAGTLNGSQGVLNARLNAEVGELCRIEVSAKRHILGEAIGFRDGLAQILPYQTCDGVRSGQTVRALGRQLSVPIGNRLLGRVINGVGEPIDGRGPLRWGEIDAVRWSSPTPLTRPRVRQPLETGVRVIDSLLTFGVGQRVGLFAGSGVGKSTLLGEIAKSSSADVNVVALIGERGREVGPFIEDCLGADGLEKSVVVVATADEQPLMRLRAAGAAMTMAQRFRDRGLNVLLMLDSITRLAVAQREIGLLLGEPPTMRGYPPSVFQLLSRLLENMGTNEHGSITGIISVLVDGDDMDEPISDCVRSIADGHVILDRRLANHGHFPAVNISMSLSRLFRDINAPDIVDAATKVRDALATYEEVEDLLRVGAYAKESSSRIDKAIQLKHAIDEFVRQGVGDRTPLSEAQQRLKLLAKQWV